MKKWKIVLDIVLLGMPLVWRFVKAKWGKKSDGYIIFDDISMLDGKAAERIGRVQKKMDEAKADKAKADEVETKEIKNG